MIKNIFITLIAIIFSITQAQAKIDIVYPSQKEVTINSESTFFSGNTEYNSTVTINNKPVKLWENNFFVHVVPLEYGKNKIKITSNKNGKIEEVTYIIKRNKPSKHHHVKKVHYIKNEEGVLCAKTIKENATVRSGPSTAFKRIYDFQEGIILYLDGKQGDYYRIKENGNDEYWIHKSNITEPINIPEKFLTKINGTKQYSDENYDYQMFQLTNPIMYTLERKGNNLNLVIHGINGEKDNNFNYSFEFDRELLGYECYYEGNNLIFKKAKLKSNIREKMPLKDINIFVDAGHGGKEKGTVGPNRINEKDINLDIAKKLISMLEKSGANVSYSRNCDIQVDLYDRVKLAKNANALISLSIHNNSLPYGKDPYIQHGTETHYYNENAKMLAEIINNNLANDLSLKNNGVKKSSFALNRSTNPISVLIEVAYMINPEEYMLLKNEKFRENVAKSIEKSLEEYIIYLKNKKNMIQ